jgi:peroxiredoxin
VLLLGAEPRLLDAARAALRELDRLAPGRAAPTFTATDLRGRRVSLEDLEGRTVLLLFWSTDCSACLPALDHLRSIRLAYPREQLELIGIALDSRVSEAQRIVEERRIDWPQICDGQAADGPVARLYDVHEAPRTIVIDGQGRIVVQDLLGDELDAALARLLRAPRQAAEPRDSR